jgi:ketosteroid isomerase-like protein
MTVDQIRAEVWAASERLIADEIAKNFEAVAGTYTPDAVLQAANRPAWVGRETILQGYHDFFQNLRDFGGGPEEVEVASSGDVAFEYGTNWVTMDTPDGPLKVVGKYSRGWKKVDGQWMIRLQTYSPDV